MAITKAQRKFLASYLPDVIHGDNTDLAQADRATFVKRVSSMDFDGAADAGSCRVAKNLHGKGLLSDLDIHNDMAGQPCIYAVFSETGADALFEVHAKG